MSIAVTEEHEALAESVRRWAQDRCPPATVRESLGLEEPFPPFWDDLAAQGWLAIHVPEELGGVGYGTLELAVVLEALGRGVVPGPFLPTALAGLLLARSDRRADLADTIAALASGTPAAVAFDVGEVTAGNDGEGLRLDGACGLVLAARHAQWLIVGGRGPDGDVWALIEAAEADISGAVNVDETRRVARVALDGVTVPPERVLGGLTSRAVADAATTLLAAEAAGVAGWAVDTAAEYAKVREQFGRPIGQFQAVKHRCADMFVRAELARATAWDVAQALDGVGEGSAELAVSAAGAVALDAAFDNAKDCVQVLGGIGFTWEHEAHLYLKRAMAARQALATPAAHKRRTAELALAGERRQPSVVLPDEAEQHRDEVRAFADEVAGLDRDAQHERIVAEGYLHPHLPEPWGRGAGPLEQLVIEEEFRRAGVRRRNLVIAEWVIPTVVEHGTPEQQERWLPDTLRAKLTWCQLFSEPGAGSDLAALSTKAVKVDGGWHVTGQKVWTTLAHEADLGILLARTNPDAPKHDGITYFVIDMRQDGVDVRPLKELTGQELFNEVFLSDAFVPDDCVIGEVDAGWGVARSTLATERVSIGSSSPFDGELRALLDVMAERDADTAELERAGALLAAGLGVASLGARSVLRTLAGTDPGGASSVRKLVGVEHEQDVSELSWELLGREAASWEGAAAGRAHMFLWNRSKTIYGGTSEVQRNVIAERLLGLPRDP